MKRRKSSGSRPSTVATQSCSPWLVFSLSTLPLLLLTAAVMVGEVSGSAIHLMGARNVSHRADRCPPKPLKALQEVLHEHLRHNTSSRTAICEQPHLLDIVVGCGAYANATVENWAKSACSESASSLRGGVSQSRPRRRTSSSLMGTKSNSVAARKSGAKSTGRRRPGSNSASFDKEMKRINTLLNKARCKPRKMLLPVTQAAWLTDEQRRYFTERVHLEPCMVEVKRCAGCCANELVECSPVKSKNKTIPFLKLESSGSMARSSNRNSDDSIEKLVVEFHTKCDCGCKITQCTQSQIYDKEDCSCRCPNDNRWCPHDQYFDDEECRCRCRRPRECSSGMIFDTRTCRCKVEDIFYAEYVLL